jgi:putative two-component system response regulator
MAIVDVYDALISERPYKSPLLHEEAVDVITTPTGKFDPNIVEVFLANQEQFKCPRPSGD